MSSVTKLWVISDLHLRQEDVHKLWMPRQAPEADICVLAGDVCDRFNLALHWVANTIGKKMPVVMVLGNHEFFSTSLPRGRREAKRIAKAMGIHLLDDSEVVLDNVRFLGGTLWTDWWLPIKGKYAEFDPADVRKEAMRLSKREFADFAEIYANEVGPNGEIARFVVANDLAKEHEGTRSYLAGALAQHHDGKTVVLTHHAPHPNSVTEEYAVDATTAGYVSDLTELIEENGPDYWIHGHTHTTFRYRVARTEFICNPKGYSRERPGFDWNLVFDI